MIGSQALSGTLIIALSLAACGRQDDKKDAPAGSGAAPAAPEQVEVDASSKDPGAWVYFDLETGAVAEVADAAQNAAWDIAFARYQIKSNGGVNGAAGVQVAALDTPYDDITAAPVEGFLTDAADGADPRTDPGMAFMRNGGWYDYDPATHALTPKARTFVVKTGDGGHFKVQLKGYYNAAGSPGFVSFVFAEIPGA